MTSCCNEAFDEHPPQNPPLLVIAAGGGTGGHMFPAQALAEVMLRKGWRVKLSTDARGGARYTGGFPPHVVEIEQVSSATFARGGGVLAKLAVPFKVLGGILSMTARMRRDRPACVVGFGGYPSIPALGGAATLLRLPRMIHEQNGGVLGGRVNKLFAKRVHRLACGTWPTAVPEGVEAVHTGNPVRAAVLERAGGAAYIAPGDYPMSILVIGGSQGARALSDNVPPGAIAALPDHILQHVSVSHQARDEDGERVRAFYDAHASAPMCSRSSPTYLRACPRRSWSSRAPGGPVRSPISA